MKDNIPSYNKLNKLVVNKNANWIEHEASKQFGKYFDNLPWIGNRIDYKALSRDTVEIDLWSSNEGDILKFVESSSVSIFTKVAFVVLDDSPLLVTKVEIIKSKFIDFLYDGGDALLFAFNDLQKPCFSEFIVVNNWKAVGFKK